MLTLRLTQAAEGDGRQRVEAALEGEGVRQTTTGRFEFGIEPDDRERVRWYLEDYLEYPVEPAPEIAAGVERRLRELGTALFEKVFHSSEDARDLWARLRGALDETRVEVVSDVDEATAIPWELLRDPRTDVALALRARAFVRAQHQTAQRARLPERVEGSLRVLLVICRPGGQWDVPFRSVASHLVRLSSEAREAFELDVLRPPTFARLSRVLRAAADAGRPYHVVHFDGHGAYLSLAGEGGDGSAAGPGVRAALLSPPRPGAHGYLVFEEPHLEGNEQLVDGPAIGNLLVETGVPVLVLNACRSAHAEAPVRPQPGDAAVADVHGRVRAYGSLAQQVVDAGVAGVVAMRYNVWVATAAQFIGDLYAELLAGRELGAAVRWGRKQLADQPNRAIAFEPLPLQDWVVPVVYEAAPLALSARPASDSQSLTIRLDPSAAGQERGRVGGALPGAPDVGFYGRDETLLALDRALDTQPIVLLHAFAGSGKTTTAVEFARWYRHTGGLAAADGLLGPVLFSSFEQYLPPARVLDRVGEAFEAGLEAIDVHWLTLSEAERREVALQVLRQRPVLWIWDNIEPIAGFPRGAPSAWSPEEQRELARLLRDLSTTQARVLLTSRRPEHEWLGELPARVELPPMPLRDSVQLARAIVDRHPPNRLTDVEDWRPLLRYAAGNPLTVTVLVGEALREGLTTREQIEAFVARLRAGEAEVADDQRQGRSRSLGASLGYGFASAFDQRQRAQLAVLHLFQGFVDVDALVLMGNREAEASVPELHDLTREAGITLLDRTAEIGLLHPYGGGYYAIHPAVPWYLSRLFQDSYGEANEPPAQTIARAYVAATAGLAIYWFERYNAGQLQDVAALAAEEANLLHARGLARKNGWWKDAVRCMQGLSALYGRQGRSAEWTRLVDEITPDLTDPASDGPLPGREQEWIFHTSFRIRVAVGTRDWEKAERLQRALIDHSAPELADLLRLPPSQLDERQQRAVINFAQDYFTLGDVLRDQGRPECVHSYHEAIRLYQHIGFTRGEEVAVFNLAGAYLDVAALLDLDEAERWLRRSLELRSEDNVLGIARSIMQLGHVELQRAEAARAAGEDAAALEHLEAAADAYQKALEGIPGDAVRDLDAIHHQLGVIFIDVGDVDAAVSHYRQSIRYAEAGGNRYSAGQARQNAALALTRADRPDDALSYARAALRDYESYGPSAADDARSVQELITALQEAQQ